MLLVQKFLETHTFQELIDLHGVYASFSNCGSFWSLSYDQIESREDDLLAQQCRGLILAKLDETSLLSQAEIVNGRLSYNHLCPGPTFRISYPFNRFFNAGMGFAAEINWNDPSLKIYNKEDGTMIQVFRNQLTLNWEIATRGNPQANVPLDSSKDLTFATLFKKTLLNSYNLSFDHFTSTLDSSFTYIFELCSVYNQIVVSYPESKIFFLGARNTHSMKEYNIEQPLFDIQIPEIPRPKTYSFKDVPSIMEWSSSQLPSQHEGVVVRDGNFNRIKVKSAAYVVAHKMRDSLGSSDRNCLELILLGKDDDALPFIPKELAEHLLEIKINYKSWLIEQQALYNKIFEEAWSILPNDKKTFALTVQKHNAINSGAFFAIYGAKAKDMKDYVYINKKLGTYPDHFLDRILSQLH